MYTSGRINMKYALEDRSLCRISSKENWDRFIPNRSGIDMDYARSMLTQSRRDNEEFSPSKEVYRRKLAEALNVNRTRVLAFKSKSPATAEINPYELISPPQRTKPAKPRRHVPRTSVRTLDAPDILDDFSLNLLDWGSANVLSIALGMTVYLWNAVDRSMTELVMVEEEDGPVTSVSWALDGKQIAVGMDNSEVQIWDATAGKLLRTLRGGHESRVGSLGWNNHVLKTGGRDAQIINNDVRARLHAIGSYKGHNQEICGLRWSGSGKQLTSGANDNLVHIWDCRFMASSSSGWVHRFREHTAAVKVLSWCPFQGNLLASGGGGSDRCIKFWNTLTGKCLKSVDTGSQVCALLWNKNDNGELLSSHGFTQNQLVLWEYPSMARVAELDGHTCRVLFMAQSPDGCTMASAAGDETLRFWNVFEVAKPASNLGPFPNVSQIR